MDSTRAADSLSDTLARHSATNSAQASSSSLSKSATLLEWPVGAKTRREGGTGGCDAPNYTVGLGMKERLHPSLHSTNSVVTELSAERPSLTKTISERRPPQMFLTMERSFHMLLPATQSNVTVPRSPRRGRYWRPPNWYTRENRGGFGGGTAWQIRSPHSGEHAARGLTTCRAAWGRARRAHFAYKRSHSPLFPGARTRASR